MTIESRIHEKLRASLSPIQLQVQNESYMHSVPPGSESHFRVVIVSPAFESKTMVQRHRMVFTAIGDIRDTIHALSIIAKTPNEWESQRDSLASPPCRGRSAQ